jgi:hypothetical protein
MDTQTPQALIAQVTTAIRAFNTEPGVVTVERLGHTVSAVWSRSEGQDLVRAACIAALSELVAAERACWVPQTAGKALLEAAQVILTYSRTGIISFDLNSTLNILSASLIKATPHQPELEKLFLLLTGSYMTIASADELPMHIACFGRKSEPSIRPVGGCSFESYVGTMWCSPMEL